MKSFQILRTDDTDRGCRLSDLAVQMMDLVRSTDDILTVHRFFIECSEGWMLA